MTDPRCPHCDVPLRAIQAVVDGRCADTEACDARRSLGPGYLISPEGVTPWGAHGRPLQAKDIDGEAVVELIRECNEARCDYSPVVAERGWGAFHGGRPGYAEGDYDPPVAHEAKLWDLAARLDVPERVLRAKLARLIKRGRITGCACGCRGDFEVVARSHD